MNFPTEVVTPKEIAHYLLFTRWHHFWGQIRTWDKSEKNQAEAELADALESYAESFRAETLEQVRDYVAEEMDDWGGPERKVLNGIRDKILARLKNPAPHAAELREQALDLANDEYNKLRKNLGYPPLDNKGRWIFEAERAKLGSGE